MTEVDGAPAPEAVSKGFEAATGLASVFTYLVLSSVGLIALQLVLIVGIFVLSINMDAVMVEGSLDLALVQAELAKIAVAMSSGQIEIPVGLIAASALIQFSGMVLIANVLMRTQAWLRWRRLGRPGDRKEYVNPQVVSGFANRRGRATTVYLAAALGGLSVGWFPGWLSHWMRETFPDLEWGSLDVITSAIENADGVSLFLMVFVVGVFGPVAEELVFRGYMWDVFRRWLPEPVVWVATSVVFAAYHMDPVHAVPLLFTALFLGWLRYMSGSIYPPIIAHVINNCLGLSQALLEIGDGEVPVLAAAAAGVFTLLMAGVAFSGRERPLASDGP